MQPTHIQTAPGGAEVHAQVERVFEGVKKAVARVCPPWLADRRDDLVQAAMLRVIRILEQERRKGEGNPSLPASYLKRVAYTVTIDEIRRLRARPETNSTDTSEAAPAAGVDPEGGAVGTEIAGAIRGCLRRLVEARRHAVTLYLLGHSVPESARMLQWTPKKTENSVYRGLADLRRCLSAKGVSP